MARHSNNLLLLTVNNQRLPATANNSKVDMGNSRQPLVDMAANSKADMVARAKVVTAHRARVVVTANRADTEGSRASLVATASSRAVMVGVTITSLEVVAADMAVAEVVILLKPQLMFLKPVIVIMVDLESWQ